MGSKDTRMAPESTMLAEVGLHLRALRRLLLGVGIVLFAVLLVAAARLEPIGLLHPPTAPPGTCATGLDTLPGLLMLVTWLTVGLASVLVGVRALSGELGASQQGGVTPREWAARTLAAAAATLLVMAAASPVLWVIATIESTPSVFGSQFPIIWSSAGFIAALGLAMGALAGAMRTPWWLALPVCIGGGYGVAESMEAISSTFTHVSDGSLQGLWVGGWVFLTAIGASRVTLVASTRGTRWARLVGALVLGAVGCMASLVGLAATVVRPEARAVVLFSKPGEIPLVGGSPKGLWALDPISGERVIPKSMRGWPDARAVWSADGTLVATTNSVGPLGTYGRHVLDTWTIGSGGITHRAQFAIDAFLQDLAWAGDLLLVATWGRVESSKGFARNLAVVDRDGNLAEIASAVAPTRPQLVVSGSRAFVEDQGNKGGHTVRRLDVDGRRLGDQPLVTLASREYSVGAPVSPSGRYWLTHGWVREPNEASSRPFVRWWDLETGQIVGEQNGWDACWIADDRVVWFSEEDEDTNCVRVGGPGPGAQDVMCRTGWDGVLVLSPDGTRLLVASSRSAGQVFGVLNTSTWQWTALPPHSIGPWDPWAGPRTIAVQRGRSGIVLVDVDNPARERLIHGDPRR